MKIQNLYIAICSCFITMHVSAIPCEPNIINPIPGSPYTTAGSSATDATFSPDGKLLAISDFTDHTVSIFQVGSDGQLTPIENSPFMTGGMALLMWSSALMEHC